jgi:regulator of sirC expression with transglutaminase-like and TPR domain
LVGFVDLDLGHVDIMAPPAGGNNVEVHIEPFLAVAARPAPTVEALALSLAAEFRDVDETAALELLDELGDEVAAAQAAREGPHAGIEALREVLAIRHGFVGDQRRYDHPCNSMLDLVLERRRGLPILLSVLYLATAQRAGIDLCGVGLPGHYVVGDLRASPPVLIDPFAGGTPVVAGSPRDVRAWGAHETALRILNNLVASYGRRADIARAIHAAELRLALPFEHERVEALRMELGALRARLN